MTMRSILAMGLAMTVTASVCLGQGGVRPGPGPVPRPGPVGGPIQPPKATPTPTPTPADEAFTGTYRFVSLKDTTLTVSPLTGDNTMTITKLAADIAKTLGNANAGDVLDIQGVKSKDKGIVIHTVNIYTPKLGEGDPFVFVFTGQTQQTVGKETFTVVNVKKYFQTSTFAVPNARDAAGKPAPLPRMMTVLEGLKAGDLVEIAAESSGKPPMMSLIKPYGTVKRMTFSKLLRLKMDPATSQPVAVAPSETAPMTGVEVMDGDTAATFVIDPKATFAPTLASQLLNFKDGQAVIVRSMKDDRGSWLLGIKLSPQQNAAKPDPNKTAAKDGA